MMVRDMDIAAELMGVNPLHAKLSAFAVSSYLCGIAGALFVFLWRGAAEPNLFDIPLSFRVLFIAIIGGLGSLLGNFLRRRPDRGPADPAALGLPRSACRSASETVEQLTSDDHRGADHRLPDRRAARARAAVADRKGESSSCGRSRTEGRRGDVPARSPERISRLRALPGPGNFKAQKRPRGQTIGRKQHDEEIGDRRRPVGRLAGVVGRAGLRGGQRLRARCSPTGPARSRDRHPADRQRHGATT